MVKISSINAFADYIRKAEREERKRAKRKAQRARKREERAAAKKHVYNSICSESERTIFAACKGTRTPKKARNNVWSQQCGSMGNYIRTNRFENSYITIVTKSRAM